MKGEGNMEKVVLKCSVCGDDVLRGSNFSNKNPICFICKTARRKSYNKIRNRKRK